MRVRLKENENNICKKYILQYLKEKCDLEAIEKNIKSDYNICITKNSNIIELVNDLYFDNNEYLNLQNNISNQSTAYNYIITNLKQLLIIDSDINSQYCPIINDNDDMPSNFVDNGTLVLKIDRTIDFNNDPDIAYIESYKIEQYAKSIEMFFQSILNIPVKILFNDIKVYE